MNAQNTGRTLHDRRKLFGRIVIEPEDDAETVAQRTRQKPRARRGADQRELRQIQPDAARRGTLAHHDIEHIIFQSRIQNLFDLTIQTVDFIDEQHVAVFEIGQDRSQVAGTGDGRTARGADVGAQLVGHHGGQRGLAQARGAAEQHVVHAFAALARSLDQDRQAVLHARLAQIVFQAFRTKRAVECQVVLDQLGCHHAFARRARACARIEHHAFYFDIVAHKFLHALPTPSPDA